MGNPIQIKENIFYVGVKDWNVRDFHGYTTPLGTTYNSYLILDEKNVLVDAVHEGFAGELLDNISKIIDPSKIDYLVSNHTEPDHTGAYKAVMRAAPNATVVASPKGEMGLKLYYGGDWNFQVVKSGDSLNIGKRTIEFIATPMLHWPDSMVTYIRDDKLLFSMDAFGQHYAASLYFDDEVSFDVLMHESKKYYANIIMHLGKVVKKTLPAIGELPIDTIATSHGIIWRKHISEIINAYNDWAECKPKPKILIIYETMWKSTEIMAKAIMEGAKRPGIDAKLIRLKMNDRTDIMTDVLDAGAIVVGSPTMNNRILPNAEAFLSYLKGLKPTCKIGAAFGSYGWSPAGAKQVSEGLAEAGVALVREPITSQFRPDESVLQECGKLGADIADRIIDYKP